MERKINAFLNRWKRDPEKKVLVVYGNKQVGKTYSVLKFGEKEYKNVVYFNADNNIELLNTLKKENTVDKIIMHLSLLSNESILTNDTLVVIDNVNDLEIINAMKVFGKTQELNYHIILITSLRENLKKFKCEELQFKPMNGVDFEEYLVAINNKQLIDFIKTAFKNNTPMPFHSVAMDYYDDYLMTGGLPEAVEMSINNQNKLLLNTVYNKVSDTYKKEISTLDTLIDITRGLEVYDSIPYQLQKQNRKFQYGLIKAGSRSKDYEKSINFLHTNGFAYKCYKVSDAQIPLSGCKDPESFKMYLNDTGLLFSRMHLTKNKFLTDINIKNIIYENSIAISLINLGYNLYYYQSEGKAEVSFVIQTRNGKILPIELVDKNLSKSKSLTLFMNKTGIKEAIRVTDENFSMKKGVKYIPIYALFCLNEGI